MLQVLMLNSPVEGLCSQFLGKEKVELFEISNLAPRHTYLIIIFDFTSDIPTIMRALAVAFWALVFNTAFAQATLIYTFDAQQALASDSKSTKSISPPHAQLLLAHRLGLSQYHSLGNVEDDVIGNLNQHGGLQASLFGPKKAHRRQLLLVVEGLVDPGGMHQSTETPLLISLSHIRIRASSYL